MLAEEEDPHRTVLSKQGELCFEYVADLIYAGFEVKVTKQGHMLTKMNKGPGRKPRVHMFIRPLNKSSPSTECVPANGPSALPTAVNKPLAEPASCWWFWLP